MKWPRVPRAWVYGFVPQTGFVAVDTSGFGAPFRVPPLPAL